MFPKIRILGVQQGWKAQFWGNSFMAPLCNHQYLGHVAKIEFSQKLLKILRCPFRTWKYNVRTLLISNFMVLGQIWSEILSVEVETWKFKFSRGQSPILTIMIHVAMNFFWLNRLPWNFIFSQIDSSSKIGQSYKIFASHSVAQEYFKVDVLFWFLTLYERKLWISFF